MSHHIELTEEKQPAGRALASYSLVSYSVEVSLVRCAGCHLLKTEFYSDDVDRLKFATS